MGSDSERADGKVFRVEKQGVVGAMKLLGQRNHTLHLISCRARGDHAPRSAISLMEKLTAELRAALACETEMASEACTKSARDEKNNEPCNQDA